MEIVWLGLYGSKLDEGGEKLIQSGLDQQTKSHKTLRII